MQADTTQAPQQISEETRARFYLTLGGHIFFQTLCAAVEFDLFTVLSRQGPLSRDDIAAQLKIEDKPARILLLGCTALGLLKRDNGKYSNMPAAEAYFNADSPMQMIPIVRWQQHINYPAMSMFPRALRENRNVGLGVFKGDENTLYGRLAHEPRLEKIFQDAMGAISIQTNAYLARFPGLSGIKTLVDVGGGNGTNLIALARQNPHLNGIVFDSETVCQYAKKNFKAADLTSRLAVHAGNCFTDAFPSGADGILFAHFFTIWSEARDKLLLKKAFDCLPPNGRVIIFNMMQSDDETGPLSAAMGSPYFLTLASGEGMLYTWAEYEEWMREAGFRDITRHVLPMDHGIITGCRPA